jgi:putative tricarboxylic transport membrane protein
MNRNDGISAVALLALGIFALIKALQLPVGNVRMPDTGFFPVVLSALLIILSLILMARCLWGKLIRENGHLFGAQWKKVVIVVAGLIAYCFLLTPIGYIPTTVAIIVLVSRLTHCSWKEACAISVVCTAVSYVAIVGYLKGSLPSGIMPF